MRPYYLDGDLTGLDHFPLRRSGLNRSGDTRYSAAAYRWRLIVASVQFSRTVERRVRRPELGSCGRALCATAPPPTDAGLSKLNSMLALL